MERPDFGGDQTSHQARMRMIARTQDRNEAERIADQYGKSGFKTAIVKDERGGIALYEVWIGKGPDPAFASRQK